MWLSMFSCLETPSSSFLFLSNANYNASHSFSPESDGSSGVSHWCFLSHWSLVECLCHQLHPDWTPWPLHGAAPSPTWSGRGTDGSNVTDSSIFIQSPIKNWQSSTFSHVWIHNKVVVACSRDPCRLFWALTSNMSVGRSTMNWRLCRSASLEDKL